MGLSSGGKRLDGLKCELCGSMSAKVKCDQCNQQFFCGACDDMFHRHPKRNTHIRKVFNFEFNMEIKMPAHVFSNRSIEFQGNCHTTEYQATAATKRRGIVTRSTTKT